jgi:hypothetical protein
MALPATEIQCDVYSNKTNVFSLWADLFDFPLFIHPFADGKRFLCVTDDDTSVLVFVVDLGAPATNAPASFGWPPDEYTRNYFMQRATNVVIGTNGWVRLPTFQEVQEVSSNVAAMTQHQYRSASFPFLDLGLYRSYWPKTYLLGDLDTNRRSVWP